MKPYDPAKIESKWQKAWARKNVYKTVDPVKRTAKGSESSKDTFYVLDMFPYPSGEGLHVGHPKGFIATDVISRMKRMQGKSVLHPMGFDSFGLPAENYAIKTKTNPEAAVKKNVARYKKQLEIIGLDYDWSREVITSDPKFYRWTQWIFLQLYKKGLAYESFEPINWCPSCKTGLANEDLEDGRCERCGTPIEKKPLRQWVLRITDYADRLLYDLDATDYVMPKLIDKVNPHVPGKPVIRRAVAHAIVFDPKAQKYLIIRNKKHGWDTVVIGGIEGAETAADTARREVAEETGYTDLEFKRVLGGPTEAHYYTKHKGENRIATAQGVYFELKSHARAKLADGEDADNEILWIDAKDFVPGKMVNSELPIWLERMKDPTKGISKKLLDWPESIKESQRNWIGRSEGAEITFRIEGQKGISEGDITVFTTRPDTLFGVTYVVLAPEHKLVTRLLLTVSNKAQVQTYIAAAAAASEMDRTDAKKEKTGVELKGIFAINPANGEKVPVWIADYVLADYGTGAVMAVPAHDDRDFVFAKKFKLPIRQVVAPYFENTTTLIPKKDKPVIRRKNVHAIVKHPKEDKYLFVKWNNDGWKSLVTGGIEEGEDIVAAGKREVLEETGYKNLKHIATSGSDREVHSYFYAKHKDENRYMIARGVMFQLIDEQKAHISEEEAIKYQIEWIPASEAREFLSHGNQKLIWDYCAADRAYTDHGVLINSGAFDGAKSIEAKISIAQKFGVLKTTYKLRDWVFSRQRYWGDPIPLIHCEGCGVVPVPEKNLPVLLPKVKSYEPTGTGESPLAAISKWVNVKCPKCKKPAKRETNTMPQWAGSSWYYLRYADPKNTKALVDPKKEKAWAPVDLYVGGAEHATRHLIYARFWHKFLYDIGAVSRIEPFAKLQSVGLIMGEDGRKMSKRFGNVVNPDEVVATYGADTLRVYEMFMGPFDQQIAWSTSSMVGSRRFIERVWKLAEKVGKNSKTEKAGSKEADKVIHKAIKKVSDDIADMKFNTAISTLMIASNDLEEAPALSRAQFESFIKLLAPFAPHVTEELWTALGNKKSIHLSVWPAYDPALAADDEVTVMVQVNGKVRGSFVAPATSSQEALEASAKAAPSIAKWLEGRRVIKTIVIPGRLVNFVVVE